MTEGHEDLTFNEIVKEYRTYVYRVALGLVGNQTDAEDVQQETFIQVYKSLSTYRGDAKISTWIYRITLRVSMRWLAKNRKPIVSLQETEGIGQSISNGEITDLLEAINELPFAARTVISLISIQGLSHKEAAEILAIPEGTVASRLHNAKKKLLNNLR